MEDYLGRAASPLSEELWKRLDEAVVETAKEILTARKFLPLYGPLGPGVQVGLIWQFRLLLVKYRKI